MRIGSMAALGAAGSLAAGFAVVGVLAGTLSVAAPDVEPITMRAKDGSEVSLAIARQFVDPSLPTVKNPTFRWARVDLDRDGYDELIVQLTAPGLCAPDGCPVIAYRRIPDTSWRPILTVVAKSLERPKTGDVTLITRGAGEPQPWVFDKAAEKLAPAPK